MAYLLAMNLLNPDALIAQENLQHYTQSGRLDGEYLATLSEDAVPVVIRVLDVPDRPAQAAVARPYLKQLTTLEQQAAEDGWPSFHLARYNALATLQANRDRLARAGWGGRVVSRKREAWSVERSGFQYSRSTLHA